MNLWKRIRIGAIVIIIFCLCTITWILTRKSPLFVDLSPATITPKPMKVMYFCGYDRCQDSGEYGQLIFETGISIWNNPDPDRGGIHHKASHGDRTEIALEKRVSEGPGGLWYQLEDGGWVSDFWLTEILCTLDNLEEHSFTDCIAGKY